MAVCLHAGRPVVHATAAFPIPRNKAMTEAAAAAMATAVGETEAVHGSSVGSGPVSFLPMPPIASEAARAREYDAEEEDDRDDAKITAPALMSRTEIHEEGEVTNADGAGPGTDNEHTNVTLHKLPISWRWRRILTRGLQSSRRSYIHV